MHLAELQNITKKSFLRSLSDKEKAEIYITLFEHFDTFSKACGFGDPFSYARSREILMACTLGHSVSDDYSGADAINQKGEPVEYKSTISKRINATYNGISVFPTWKEQEKYLREEKIGKYPEHFWARFSEGRIVEMWKASGEAVLNALLPKLEKRFHAPRGKDPRLGVTLSATEIASIGDRIL
jgi:hypothetical protein